MTDLSACEGRSFCECFGPAELSERCPILCEAPQYCPPSMAPTPAAATEFCSQKSCAELQWLDGVNLQAYKSKGDNNNVCGWRVDDKKCYSDPVTYTEASKICEDRGARLCTHEEYSSGDAAGSGCQLDKKFVWTSGQCAGGHIIGKVYDGDGGKAAKIPEAFSEKCASDNARYYAGRCCADTKAKPCSFRASTPSTTLAPPSNNGGNNESMCDSLSCADLAWDDEIKHRAYKNEQTPNNGVCSSSLCQSRVMGYSDALAVCTNVGARLCTSDEFKTGEGGGTGCKLDKKFVWTMSKGACGKGQHEIAYIGKKPEDFRTQCEDDSNAQYAGRCCADNNKQDTCDKLKDEETQNTVAPQCGSFKVSNEQCGSKSCCGELKLLDTVRHDGYRNAGLGDSNEVCGTSLTCASHTSVSYFDAKKHCEDFNARLCTVEEYQAGDASGTGCFLDKKYVWVSGGSCEAGKHVVAKAGKKPNDFDQKCEEDGGFFAKGVRCCADTYNSPLLCN